MTEESLMAAVKQGDLDKSGVLFEKYHRQLYGFFLKLSRDPEVARDLVQNVFYRMLKYRHTYQQEQLFKAWIYQIARNAFADHHRKNKIKIDDPEVIEKAVGHENGIDGQWEEDEKKQQLHKSLALLAEEDRQILILSRFQKMKYEEIAQVMNYSVSNVKIKVHRAIKRLREHYYELEKI